MRRAGAHSPGRRCIEFLRDRPVASKWEAQHRSGRLDTSAAQDFARRQIGIPAVRRGIWWWEAPWSAVADHIAPAPAVCSIRSAPLTRPSTTSSVADDRDDDKATSDRRLDFLPVRPAAEGNHRVQRGFADGSGNSAAVCLIRFRRQRGRHPSRKNS